MIKLQEIYNLLKEKKLLKNNDQEINDTNIEDITYDSREVKEGSLFFCKGQAFKKEYLLNSVKAGAVAYVSETDYEVDNVVGLIVTDVRKAMIIVAQFFFDFPDRKIKIIGVTGTKGKTTTVKYLKAIFDYYLEINNKRPCGIISTVNTYDGINDIASQLTTPEAIPLFRYLKNAVDSGLEYMLLEASSQALKYDRVTSVEFDIAAFLNIGDDHVSPIEHPSLEDYFKSKLSLADLSKVFIYNSTMDQADKVKDKLETKKQENYTFSLTDTNSDIYAKDIIHKLTSTKFKAVYDGQEKDYMLKQPGDYNVENALCAILIAYKMGLDYESIKSGLMNAVLEGRDNIQVSDDGMITAWISYAHNGLSFQKSFDTIKQAYSDYNIISVFGGSGDKAFARLRDVSTIGAKYSDYIILVPDDPGSVPYEEIIEKMKDFIEAENTPYEVFDIRARGIQRAFDLVKEKTILFIAGKGADAYNVINGEYVEIEDDVTATNRIMKDYNEKNK